MGIPSTRISDLQGLEVPDIRLRPRRSAPPVTFEYALRWRRLCLRPIEGERDVVIHKTEVHDILHCRQRRTGAVSLCFLFVHEISREPLNRFAPNSHRRRLSFLAWMTLKVAVKGQGLPGHKWHFSALVDGLRAVCVR